jgi:glycosyltransferase involved in cell wall biosynthesis
MEKQTKILICIPSYTFGGAEIHSLYTARALQKNSNREVYFLAFGRIDSFKTKLEEEGFKTLHFNLNDFLTLGIFRKCIQLVKLILFLKPYKFKFIFSGTEQCNLLMGLTWKMIGVKKFFWHQWGIDARINLGFWERIVVKSKPTYVANSDMCKQNVVKRHQLGKSTKVRIIHNTFNEKLLLDHPDFDTKEFRLVMVANFFDEKDHETILRAFELFIKKQPEAICRLFFIGRGNGSTLLLQTKALAFDLNLSEKVVFVGNSEKVSEWLPKMHIGILSTKSEGFSNALIEYMAVGLPIIATDISQNKEVVGECNKEWLFPIGNSEKCCELIEKLYMNRQLISEISKRNKVHVAKFFSSEKYEELINDLLSVSK